MGTHVYNSKNLEEYGLIQNNDDRLTQVVD